jgi:hypothetical protein
MGSAAWRKSFVGSSASDWLPPPPEPERRALPHDDTETSERRREKSRRAVERASDRWLKPTPPRAAPAPAPVDYTTQTPDGNSWTPDGRYCRWIWPTNSGRERWEAVDIKEVQLAAKRRRESADSD